MYTNKTILSDCPWETWDHQSFRFWLRSGMHNSESDSVLGCIPRRLEEHANRGVVLLVGCTPQIFLRYFLFLTRRWNPHFSIWIGSMTHTGESDSAESDSAESDSEVGCTPRSFLKNKYLGEIKTKFDQIIDCILGAQMGSKHENKNRGCNSKYPRGGFTRTSAPLWARG